MTVSRRAVLRSAAWTVPAIALATAAPAAVASQSVPLPACQTVQHTVPLASFATGASGTTVDNKSYLDGRVWSVPPASVASATQVQIDVRTVFDENSVATADHYKKFTLNQTGGTAGLQMKNQTALKFSMAVNGNAGSNYSKPVGQTITVTFSQPVRNLSFVITDIDGNGTNQWDRVFLTEIDGETLTGQPPFTVAYGGNVSGAGTTSDPWQSAYSASVGDENANGNVRVTVNRELTSFTFRFRNVAAAAHTNSLNLTQLSFESLATVECTPV